MQSIALQILLKHAVKRAKLVKINNSVMRLRDYYKFIFKCYSATNVHSSKLINIFASLLAILLPYIHLLHKTIRLLLVLQL